MDIEWAKDGSDGRIYILQARPETVKSRKSAEGQERFLLKQKSEVLATARAIGHNIAAATRSSGQTATRAGPRQTRGTRPTPNPPPTPRPTSPAPARLRSPQRR